MTEKRFIQLDSGCDFLVKDTLRNETFYDGKVVDLLNEQHRSIDKLINDEKYWEKKAKQRVKELQEENEQLKQQLNRLYNYFEDWYRDMTSANDFSEIWDNVKEDERWGDNE